MFMCVHLDKNTKCNDVIVYQFCNNSANHYVCAFIGQFAPNKFALGHRSLQCVVYTKLTLMFYGYKYIIIFIISITRYHKPLILSTYHGAFLTTTTFLI